VSLTLAEAKEWAAAQGFTHIETAGGKTRIEQWQPYGEKRVDRLRFKVDGQQLVDLPVGRREGFGLGVWTFTREGHAGACAGPVCARLGGCLQDGK
jgi:hypothetical protein